MRYVARTAVSVAGMLFVAGCASCPQEPTQAGFFCGVQNLASGTYEQRKHTLRWQAEQAESLAQGKATESAALQREVASTAAEEQTLKAQLAVLHRNLAREQQALAKARQERLADQDTLTRLEGQVRALQIRQAELSRSYISPQEVEVIREQNNRLHERIAKVLQLRRVE